MQYLQMLKCGTVDRGPRSGGPLFGLLLLTVVLGLVAAPVAGSPTDDDAAEQWRRWAENVQRRWDAQREEERAFTSASFQSILDAYQDMPERVDVGRISEQRAYVLRALLGAIWTLNHDAVLLPEADRAGYSPLAGFREAAEIGRELLRRDALGPEDDRRLVQLAIGVYEFPFARWAIEQTGYEVQIPPVKEQSVFSNDTPYRIWKLNANGELERSGFDFPSGLHWVVVASEGCGFTQAFLGDIAAHEPTRELIGGRVQWLIPPKLWIDFDMIEEVRTRNPAITPYWIHRVDDWPMFSQFQSSPRIYLMKGERVLASWTGWPLDRSYLPQMIEAFQQHAGGGAVQRTPPDVTLRH